MSDKDRPNNYSINIVETRTDASGAEKDHWTEIGIAFPHRNGKGFTLKLPASILVRGDANLVMREISPRSQSSTQQQAPPREAFDFDPDPR